MSSSRWPPRSHCLFNVWLLFIFSILGCFMHKLDFPVPPVVVGLVLGPMIQVNLKRSLQISHGDISILFLRPIAGALMLVFFLILLAPLVRPLLKRRSAFSN